MVDQCSHFVPLEGLRNKEKGGSGFGRMLFIIFIKKCISFIISPKNT
jgi:hypothetical protein